MLLTGLFSMARSFLHFYATQGHLQKGGIDHSDLDPPTPINQDNVPTNLPTGQSEEAFCFQLNFPLP